MTETRTPSEAVSRYYTALDEGDYELLDSLLVPDFVHDRPAMTLEGRDRFVRFMREERPLTDTRHPIDAVYRAEKGAEIAARGRLLAADGSQITGFVDVFSFEGDSIARIETYVSK